MKKYPPPPHNTSVTPALQRESTPPKLRVCAGLLPSTFSTSISPLSDLFRLFGLFGRRGHPRLRFRFRSRLCFRDGRLFRRLFSAGSVLPALGQIQRRLPSDLQAIAFQPLDFPGGIRQQVEMPHSEI